MKRNYGIKVSFDGESYNFEIDFGIVKNPTCTITNEDDVIIDFSGYDTYPEKDIMLNRILKFIFGDKVAGKMIDSSDSVFEHVPSAFKKTEDFLTTNNIPVKNINIRPKKEDEFNPNKSYKFRSIYDEGLGIVSFYIKSELFEDEMAIRIYPDGSFSPEISTRHSHITLSEQAQEERKKVIKKFIRSLLKVNINFGTVGGGKPLKILDLYGKAMDYAKENGTVKFTEENGDFTICKESDSEEIVLNSVGRI